MPWNIRFIVYYYAYSCHQPKAIGRWQNICPRRSWGTQNAIIIEKVVKFTHNLAGKYQLSHVVGYGEICNLSRPAPECPHSSFWLIRLMFWFPFADLMFRASLMYLSILYFIPPEMILVSPVVFWLCILCTLSSDFTQVFPVSLM